MTWNPPMDLVSSVGQYCFCIRRDLNRLTSGCSFGPAATALVDPGTGDVSTEAEMRKSRRSRSAMVTRGLVLLARSASTLLTLEAVSAATQYWSRVSTMVCINSNEDTSSVALWRFLNSYYVLDHFSFDPGNTTIEATGHQFVKLCRSFLQSRRRRFLIR